jgi:uncharacterized surface protein with fasciclin (FAS1) repeats
MLLLAQCQKERDVYYEAPDWIGKPVYETLQDEGRFGKYLQLVDKTRYALSLKGNGLWTVFAPNDAAVDAWLSEKGYASVDAVPASEAGSIVAYSLLFNQFEFSRLANILNNGWDTVVYSMKKRTPYYKTIRKEFYRGDSVWVVDPTTNSSPYIAVNDNNYRYLPFYLDKYFKAQSPALTEDDYRFFYPNSTYTGKNIQRASVLKEDISAANGIIHEVDRVNEPLPTLEEILGADERYSVFHRLITSTNDVGEPNFYSYEPATETVLNYYMKMFPSLNIQQLYIKTYWSRLGISLNMDRYQEPGTTQTSSQAIVDWESGGYTEFVPNDAAIADFFNTKLASYGYPAIDSLPSAVLKYFLNAQLVGSLVWPRGNFKLVKNAGGDYLNGMGEEGPELDRNVYSDIRPASNGFFYGGSQYIRSRYFETVYTEILLRSAGTLSLMYRAFQNYFAETLVSELTNCILNYYPNVDYTVLLPENDAFAAEGLELNGSNVFIHNAWETAGGTFTNTRVQRLMRSHIFRRTKSPDANKATSLTEFSGGLAEYGGYGYAVNDYGDMIRFKNNQLQMLGNYDAGDWVTVTPRKTFLNGQVFTVDKMLQYSVCTAVGTCAPKTMREYIIAAGARNANVSKYVDYMSYLLPTGNNIANIELATDRAWTLLMPTNTAIDQAVADHVLPTITDVKNTSLPVDTLNKAIRFFKYHIIPDELYMDEGYPCVLLKNGSVQDSLPVVTNYRNDANQSTYLMIDKTDATSKHLRFSTYDPKAKNQPWANRRVVAVIRGEDRSNQFGARAVLHEVDDYLVYKNIENN